MLLPLGSCCAAPLCTRWGCPGRGSPRDHVGGGPQRGAAAGGLVLDGRPARGGVCVEGLALQRRQRRCRVSEGTGAPLFKRTEPHALFIRVLTGVPEPRDDLPQFSEKACRKASKAEMAHLHVARVLGWHCRPTWCSAGWRPRLATRPGHHLGLRGEWGLVRALAALAPPPGHAAGTVPQTAGAAATLACASPCCPGSSRAASPSG